MLLSASKQLVIKKRRPRLFTKQISKTVFPELLNDEILITCNSLHKTTPYFLNILFSETFKN